MLVKNISNGPRGIWLADGTLAMLASGQSDNLDIAPGETAGEWFEFEVSEESIQTSDTEPQSERELTDAELRDAIEAATGKRPHHKLSRAKLLELFANTQEI